MEKIRCEKNDQFKQNAPNRSLMYFELKKKQIWDGFLGDAGQNLSLDMLWNYEPGITLMYGLNIMFDLKWTIEQ